MTSPEWRSNGGRWSIAASRLLRVFENETVDLLQPLRTVAGPNGYGADGPGPGHRWTLAFGHGGDPLRDDRPLNLIFSCPGKVSVFALAPRSRSRSTDDRYGDREPETVESLAEIRVRLSTQPAIAF
jgi:hypothetical protein